MVKETTRVTSWWDSKDERGAGCDEETREVVDPSSCCRVPSTLCLGESLPHVPLFLHL